MSDELNAQDGQLDIDSLLAEVEAPSPPRPEGDAGTPQTNQQPTETAAQAAERMLKINWRGTEKEVPESTVIRGYQQTYDLDQRYKEFKEQQAEWEKQRAEYDAIVGKYKQIDEYALQHPGWAEAFQQQYERSLQQPNIPEGADPNDPMVQQVIALQKELSEVKSWKQQVDEMNKMREAQAAETQLNGDIAKTKEQYKDIDWDTPNDQGLNLENQIIKYGIDNEIPDFGNAAKLYLYDTMVKLAEEKARKAASEEIQTKNKLGIVSRGATQQRVVPMPGNVREQSYDQITEGILREIAGG